ncbi:MAG: 30S ribosome-binding factor RbfA [bacterium]|nr:30S ribosome-binding factor RbfA [bacterium]
MKSRRQDRMEALIQKEISALIGYELDVFEGFFVTITGVDISRDFRNVKVLYSVLGNDEVKKAFIKKLHKHKAQIRFGMGQRINSRTVPLFKFEYDENVERAARIENILSEINRKEKDIES